ncbi:metallophosphoesterase [Psychrobacter urativorans]|uniref:metallophosphoesterase n=1 Tax=Psychrobacter urativorans TaxID=45610 RepID=UPI0019189E70|nr:metallophosphoesterase [Psychrobacter urativorans]
MLKFIVITQVLALSTSAAMYWLLRIKRRRHIVALVTSVVIINNIVLIYGLSEYKRGRFDVYLVVSILQGFMVYAALITAVIAGIYCRVLKQKQRPRLVRTVAVGVYIGIVGLSVFNAYSPVVHRLTVKTNKPLDKPLTMALVSDTHLDRLFGNRQLKKLVNLVEAQNVDVVLLAGDIMNDSTYYYDKTNMHEQLSKLQAPLGVYAVLGNHDYSGNQVPIAKAVERAGIQVIDNKSVLLDESVWLVGRSDETDIGRPIAKDLLMQVDIDKPVIIMEHNPSEIEIISALPVDLHLSGHTHGGQIFPLTTYMKWFKPLVHGAKQIAGTQFLVTSGYGFGAVPFRLGTRAEIWVVTLQPAEKPVD